MILKNKIKNTIRPIYEQFWKIWERLVDKPVGDYPLVIQGIQRSGTNYITVVLSQANYKIVNKIDPARNNPKHKHFRWQEDKSTILMDRRYKNKITANTLSTVNQICGYSDNYKHVVIYRTPEKWLNSIYRWGLGCGWFNNEAEFFDKGFHVAFLKEWDAYYAFWQSIKLSAPERVLFIEHGQFAKNPIAGLERVDRFMQVKRSERVKIEKTIDKVRHSRPLSEARETCDENKIKELLKQELEFDWCYAKENTN